MEDTATAAAASCAAAAAASCAAASCAAFVEASQERRRAQRAQHISGDDRDDDRDDDDSVSSRSAVQVRPRAQRISNDDCDDDSDDDERGMPDDPPPVDTADDCEKDQQIPVCQDCGYAGHKSKKAYTKCPLATRGKDLYKGEWPWGKHAPADYVPAGPRISCAPSCRQWADDVKWGDTAANHTIPEYTGSNEDPTVSKNIPFDAETPLVDLYIACKGGEEIIKKMVEWTRVQCDILECGRKIYKKVWQGPITVARIFCGDIVLIANGLRPCPSVRDMFSSGKWVNNVDIIAAFKAIGLSATQARRQFEQLKNVLRFQDPVLEKPTEGEFTDDTFHLVRPVFEAFNSACLYIFVAGRWLSLDEIAIGFQGRGKIKDTIKFKNEGDGSIVDTVTTSCGIILAMKFRKDNTDFIDGPDDVCPLYKRSLFLLSKLSGKWRTCLCDNLFSSIPSFYYAFTLHQVKMLGVVRGGRGFPDSANQKEETTKKGKEKAVGTVKSAYLSFGLKTVPESDGEDSDGDNGGDNDDGDDGDNQSDNTNKRGRCRHDGRTYSGSTYSREDRLRARSIRLQAQQRASATENSSQTFGILAVSVYDSKVVKVFSTANTGANMTTFERKVWNKVKKEYENIGINRLDLIITYNTHMNGVDIADQYRYYYRPDGKRMWHWRRWTWSIYSFIVNQSVVQAYRLHVLLCKRDGIEPKSHKACRIEVLEGLIERVQKERVQKEQSEQSRSGRLSYPSLTSPSGKGLNKSRLYNIKNLKRHAPLSKEQVGAQRATCQVCRAIGPGADGKYRGDVAQPRRAKLFCRHEQCLSSYCSCECFNLWHHDCERP